MKYQGSIRKKLIRIILLVSVLTAFIGYSGFAYWFFKSQQERSIDISHTIGLVISQNIAKMILLKDINIGADISSSLKSFKKLNKITIYNLDKKVIYKYSRDNSSYKAKPFLWDNLNTPIIYDSYIEILTVAKYQDTHLGYICLDINTQNMSTIIKSNIIMLLLLWLLMFIISYLLAVYYAKHFTSPILKLVSFLEEIETIDIIDKHISTNQDNEYGKLYSEINFMLDRIKQGHNTLKEHQNNLENIIESKINENTKHIKTLQQQSKLAAMGDMIGAIAHQWRQPLNAISTGIQNLRFDYRDGNLNSEEFVIKFINRNKKTISFMSSTIDDFRGFLNIDKERIDFKVKETTQAVLKMQAAQLEKHNISFDVIGEEFTYNGYRGEYQQVILNLISNAKDALVENKVKNPTIIIELKKDSICVRDNAGGINEEIIHRIFEPYFSTKEEGAGSGIGLYISKMIIEGNMGGSLSVENIPDGALFCIHLG